MQIAAFKSLYVAILSSTAASIAISIEGWYGVAAATVLVTACDRIGVTISNYTHRRRTDAISLLNNRCPDCGSPLLEVTSDDNIACASCHVVYHPLTDNTVKRMGREKTDESQGG